MMLQLEMPLQPMQPMRQESEKIYCAVRALRERGFDVIRVGRQHRIIDRTCPRGRLCDDRQLLAIASLQLQQLPEIETGER
jgi:hypothetical protein